MSQTSPTPIPTLPTAPNSASPSTFNTLMDALLGALAGFVSGANALAINVYNNAVDCYNNAVAAAASAVSAAASATTATSAAGATAWAAGVYPQYAVAISTVNFQTYRKITASSATAVDPANDQTNWVALTGGIITTVVTGTTQNAAAGHRYMLTNVAATAVDASALTPSDGDEIEIVPSNGLLTNTVDFGAMTVQGPNGTLSGTITLDLGVSLHVKYVSTITKWVSL